MNIMTVPNSPIFDFINVERGDKDYGKESLDIAKGKLSVISGQVGAGKTTEMLCQAMMLAIKGTKVAIFTCHPQLALGRTKHFVKRIPADLYKEFLENKNAKNNIIFYSLREFDIIRGSDIEVIFVDNEMMVYEMGSKNLPLVENYHKLIDYCWRFAKENRVAIVSTLQLQRESKTIKEM